MPMVLAVAEAGEKGLRKVSYEVTAQARLLADAMGGEVTALAITGAGGCAEAGALGAYGADRVLIAADQTLAVFQGDHYAQVVKAAIGQTGAGVVLFPATSAGRELAPRVAAALDGALASDCIAISWQEGGLTAQKPLYAGKVVAKVVLAGDLQMASLRPNVFTAGLCRPGATAPVEPLALPPLAGRSLLKEVRRSDSGRLDVSEADVILCGGRGMRAPENFALLEEIAALLGGAVGATRAVVDAGWRPHSEQVGQTGKVVSPSLYIMCGASGSIQHWAGMSGSRCIVAVNKDPNAPIMGRADYSITGDLFEILPLLKEEIARLRG
ncbi:MAG TPA: electron transfer flavoprotein subunit alpha/FixB family protein [bacterium]|nr:electron transfer flavoprotein subunit alpha/FixB family protein [bacterium]